MYRIPVTSTDIDVSFRALAFLSAQRMLITTRDLAKHCTSDEPRTCDESHEASQNGDSVFLRGRSPLQVDYDHRAVTLWLPRWNWEGYFGSWCVCIQAGCVQPPEYLSKHTPQLNALCIEWMSDSFFWYGKKIFEPGLSFTNLDAEWRAGIVRTRVS